MSEIIARAAKAAKETAGAMGSHFDDFVAVEVVRAVIAAMREPLVKQLLDKRFTSAAKYHGRLYHDCIPELMVDVIDEALK